MPNDLGTQTNVFRIRAGLSARSLGRGKIVSVRVLNPLQNANLSANVLTVLVGDGGAQAIPLLPGQETNELFTSDLKDIYVRVAAAVEIDPGPPPVIVSSTDVVVTAHRYPKPVRNIYDRGRH